MSTFKDIDYTLIKTLPNPGKFYTIIIEIPEFTFEGVGSQPDFGTVKIIYHPKDKILELKSLKEFKDSLRSVIMSYERFVNQLHNQLQVILDPYYLKVAAEFNPRGGITTTVIKGRMDERDADEGRT